MKKIYLLSVILLVSVIGFSQAYKPMLKENKTWDVVEHGIWGFPVPQTGFSRYVIDGDTLVSDQQYHKIQRNLTLSGTDPWNCCPPVYDTTKVFTGILIREDTIARKVWTRQIGDTLEYLAYDFSLNIGDTLTSWNRGGYNRAIIDSIVPYNLVNNEITKAFYVTPIDFTINSFPVVIEGIGGVNGFYYPFDYEFEFDVDLACVKDNGEILWFANGDVGNCGNITSITSNNTDNSLFDIYPNPNNGEQVSIVGENLKTIEILNLQGQLIKTIEASTNEVLINLENQAKGIYFVKARFKNGEIVIKKLVVN